MSPDQILKYRCHAIMSQDQRCNRPCWGKTAYCHWHNTSLFWQSLWESTDSSAQRGSPYRAFFDPEFAQSWKTPTWATGRLFLFLLLIILLAGGFFSLTPTFSLSKAIFVLWGVGILCVWWMTIGNKNLLLPKLLVVVVLVATVVQYVGFVTTTHVVTIQSILQFAYLVGVFLLTVPILPGPLVNRNVDITNRETLPPVNMGEGCLKTLGFLLVFLSITSLFFGQFLFFIGVAIAALPLSSFFSSMGSLSAVRGEWHREDIYNRCVRPYVAKVIAFPIMLGWILFVFFALYFTGSIPIITPLVKLNVWLSLLIATFAGMIVSIVWARRRGVRIYSANVRRADYLDIHRGTD